MSLAPPKTTNVDKMASIAAGCMTGAILLHNGTGWIIALAGAALGFSAIAIAATDRRRFIIPDHLVALMAVAGIVAATWSDGAFDQARVLEVLVRSAFCAGMVWLVRWLHLAMRGSQGLGLGDVKLAAAAGCWLEPALFGLSLSVAALTAVVGMRLLRRRRVNRRTISTRIPFGAFWAPAIWLTWLVSQFWRASF